MTIDYDLQKAAEDGFRHAGFNGAALIMDPRNGEVLVLRQPPGLRPERLRRRHRQRDLGLAHHRPAPAAAEPRAAGALLAGIDVQDRGRHGGAGGGPRHARLPRPLRRRRDFFGRYYQCHLKGGHGSVDMRHAIEKSCNVYFYTLGNMLGVDRIYKWAEKLGLAGKTGIDLPNEQESLVPNTEWKRKRYGERWYPGETISVAIGQGQVSVTPASLALMITTVANGGTRVTPHVVKAVDDGQRLEAGAGAAGRRRSVAFRPETLAALHDGLWMVVNASGHRRPGADSPGATCRARPARRR